MNEVEKKLDAWKKHLIDLGRRNPLINFRTQSKFLLRFTKPSMFELWDRVVNQGNSIEFSTLLEDDEDEGEEDADPCDSFLYGEVETNHKPKDAQRILHSLRKKAKAFSNEQGINVLYMVFGIVEWKESQSSLNANRSPLILVPVSLTWESINSPIRLSMLDDDIVLNPAIKRKFVEDFNIEIPDFLSEDELSSYFETLSTFLVSKGFNVCDEVYLSILSFSKMSIYGDIEKHFNEMSEHPLIKAISGDVSGLKKQWDVMNSMGEFNHDSENPSEVFQIVDADSSQQDAISYAKLGVSFILQGPPGTGKSQTITNIISEQIAAGKKVLFVSEKKAALDIVFKRLESAGLADFCLVLHDTKANRKTVVEQLGTVLDMSSKQAEISEHEQMELHDLVMQRNSLNEYADELNRKIEPLKKSLFQAYGELSKLDGVDDVVFSLPDVSHVSDVSYRNSISLLNRLKETMSRLTTRLYDNPWRNSSVPYVSYDFELNLKVVGKRIVENCSQMAHLLDSISKDTSIDTHETLEDVLELADMLKTAGSYPNVPNEWFSNSCLVKIESIVQNGMRLKKLFEERSSKARNAYESLNQSIPSVFTDCSQSFDDSQAISNALKELDDYIERDPFFSSADRNPSKIDFLKRTIHEAYEFRREKALVLRSYSKEVFSSEPEAMLQRFEASRWNPLKNLKPSYRKDRSRFLSMKKDSDTNFSDSDAIAILRRVCRLNALQNKILDDFGRLSGTTPNKSFLEDSEDIQTFESKSEVFRLLKEYRIYLMSIGSILDDESGIRTDMKSQFGVLYNGFATNWEDIESLIKWVGSFLCKAEGFEMDKDSFINALCSSQSFSSKCRSYANDLEDLYKKLDGDVMWFSNHFKPEEGIVKQSFDNIATRVASCMENLDLLNQWNDVHAVMGGCRNAGLGDYLELVMDRSVSNDQIVDAFKKRFFHLWIDSVIQTLPSVRDFKGYSQESHIAYFRNLDKEQLEIAKKAVKVKLINNLPDVNAFPSFQVNILRRELQKQRRLIPVRKLFNQIPDLLITLKPCLLMSPLSVSQYLESGNYVFDTVIFDEASQIKTENALGAIFRGKQVIIAGDSNQLPPTSFFDKSDCSNDFDEDEDEGSGILDTSLLEEAQFLPSRELLWHYRSRHEHLIAFSNAKIYRNRLISFPSNRERCHGFGVEYLYVKDGIYNGRENPRGNIAEAKRIAEEVFKHFREFPDRSIGVVAFGTVQEEAIERQILNMRRENPQYEAFFKEDKEEPFFVKSLENVQGDERDTIIFSIGYAKDRAGIMRMNFGPLSKIGGEKRLNVAITRAKYNVKLVGSILPTDIQLERISELGPKLLRKYIEFAISGPEVLERDISESESIEFDSPFEESVYDFLTNKGFKVSTQVGCSVYRIDMAVKHPKLSGVFVLGIECDGAMYHSSRTARERDRLRQERLESMGWKLYRIWSTDWMRDTARAKDRLLKEVNSAIDGYVEDDVPKTDETTVSSIPVPGCFDGCLSVKERENDSGLFQDYKATKIELKGNLQFIWDSEIAENLKDIIRNEGPVHHDIILKRFLEAKRSNRHDEGCRLTMYEKDAIDNSFKGIDYFNEGEFYSLYSFSMTRKPRKAGDRSIQQIPKCELKSGMMSVLRNGCGLSREDLIRNTARGFGFARFGSNIKDVLEEVFASLESENALRIADGVVRPNKA